MSFIHGKRAHITLDSENITGYLDSADFSPNVDVAETSTLGNDSKTYIVGLRDSTLSLSGRWSSERTNQQQTIEVDTPTPDGGTFTLTFDGQETDPIDWDASAADIQAALEDLSNIGIGDVKVTGGDLPAAVVVEFKGDLAAEDHDVMIIDNTLVDSGTYEVTITREGVSGEGIDAFFASRLQGAPFPFEYGPEGNSGGSVKYTGDCHVTSYNITAPVGDVVAFSADLQTTGDVTKGTF